MIWFASRLIRTCFLMGCFVLAGLIGLPQVAPAATEVSDRLAGCARIDDNAARLECFDEMTGRKKSGSGKDREVRSEAKAIPASEKLSETKRPPSVMEKHWDLGDESQRQKSFVLRPYRMNYFLPVAYNSSPNDETNLEYDPAAKAQFNEAKFQLSFKVKVFEGLFQGRLPDVYDRLKVPQRFQVVREADVWAGYTQLCFWQLYNSAFSSPFRDTNYEPEFLLNLRMDYEILGFQGRFVSVGFNHQSNGRSRPLSRSWNRIVANIGLEREFYFCE